MDWQLQGEGSGRHFTWMDAPSHSSQAYRPLTPRQLQGYYQKASRASLAILLVDLGTALVGKRGFDYTRDDCKNKCHDHSSESLPLLAASPVVM